MRYVVAFEIFSHVYCQRWPVPVLSYLACSGIPKTKPVSNHGDWIRSCDRGLFVCFWWKIGLHGCLVNPFAGLLVHHVNNFTSIWASGFWKKWHNFWVSVSWIRRNDLKFWGFFVKAGKPTVLRHENLQGKNLYQISETEYTKSKTENQRAAWAMYKNCV